MLIIDYLASGSFLKNEMTGFAVIFLDGCIFPLQPSVINHFPKLTLRLQSCETPDRVQDEHGYPDVTH